MDEDDFYAPHWETTIEKDGLWPMRWTWRVSYTCHRDREYHTRSGETRTKDKAQRRAAAARVSIERNDLLIRE